MYIMFRDFPERCDESCENPVTTIGDPTAVRNKYLPIHQEYHLLNQCERQSDGNVITNCVKEIFLRLQWLIRIDIRK